MDSWTPDVPSADECVLGPLLTRAASQWPTAVHARFQDGQTWTFEAALAKARLVAHHLRDLGVSKGEPVLMWLPNGPEAVRAWYGINLAGGIYAPINTAYRGALLEHTINLTGARVLLAHPKLVEHLDGLDVPRLTTVIPFEADTWTSAVAPVESAAKETQLEPWDPYAIIFTSGTTGPSKGVICSYVHLATSSTAAFEDDFGPESCYMVNLPLFHAGGTIGVYASLLFGGSIYVVERFDTRRFWHEVRASGTTHVTLLGAMANFLYKQDPTPEESGNPLSRVIMLPLIDDLPGFVQRFGVTAVSMYNMTEISIPIISEPNPAVTTSCGRLRRGVQARLVDDHDQTVPDGETGELILRCDRPWSMNSGYWGMPEESWRVWRNGWFHTGDLLRKDREGNFYFVDRKKDTIRRRGENISSFEVEREALAFPAVQEAAAVGVPSPFGEDDLLVVVAPKPGSTIEPKELFEFLRSRAAHFMVPRYIRVVAELPKTPTNKIEKHRLRAAGVDDATWDREAAGFTVKHAALRPAEG